MAILDASRQRIGRLALVNKEARQQSEPLSRAKGHRLLKWFVKAGRQYHYLLGEGLPRLLLHNDVHLELRLHLPHHVFALLLQKEAGHARRPDGDGLGADGGDQIAQHLLGRLAGDSQAVNLSSSSLLLLHFISIKNT